MFRDFDRWNDDMILAISIGVLIGIAINVFYFLTLQNCLKNVSPENRKMPPANVWLLFIPLFGTVYQFIVVGKIADSLAAEFQKRGINDPEPRPGYNIGLAYCICFVAGVVPLIGGLASLAGLVCWIIYWVKINNYKNQLGPLPDDSVLDSNFR